MPTITSWQWDFGDGHTSAQQSPAHTYQRGGVYEGSLTVHDDAGESHTRDFRIIVTQYGAHFDWDFGDGGSGYGEQVEHEYTLAGPKTVVLTARNYWGVDQDSANVNIMVYGIAISASPLSGRAPLSVDFAPSLYLTY